MTVYEIRTTVVTNKQIINSKLYTSNDMAVFMLSKKVGQNDASVKHTLIERTVNEQPTLKGYIGVTFEEAYDDVINSVSHIYNGTATDLSDEAINNLIKYI